MSYSVLQTNHKPLASAGTPVTLAFTGAVIAGSLLICCVNTDHSQDGGGISVPTGGGTWARIGTTQLDATNNQDCTWFKCENATGGSTTVSITTTGGFGFDGGCIVIAEFSGVATSSALDVSDTTKAFGSTTTSTDAETSNNITPAGAGELILAVIHDPQGTAPTLSAGTGFTLAIAEPGTSSLTGAVALEWKSGGSGSQNATWTVNKTGDRYTVQIAAFKAAGGILTSKTLSMSQTQTIQASKSLAKSTITSSLLLLASRIKQISKILIP